MRRKRRQDIMQAIVLAFVAGALLFAGWGFAEARKVIKAYTPNNLSRLQTGAVPAGIVRLHVIANSDDATDQEIKLKVRDAVMEVFGGELVALKSSDEAESYISESLLTIEEVASECLSTGGAGYGAKAALRTVYFPDRSYETGDGQEVFLPHGDYRALQIVLGKGEGQNWWCVMYPPLCYFDLVQRAVALSTDCQALSPRGPEGDFLLVDESHTEELPIELRFFLLDAVRSGLQKLTAAFRFEVGSAFSERSQNMP